MNVGELTAKLKLNTAEFDSAVKGISGSVGGLAKGVGSALGAVSTAVGAGVAAAAAGITSLVKQSVESFADYEQLVGGVETLFKESAGIVEDYAVQAYKTAGISANEYMNTVTSFSASLIQSLGGDTEKAADYANRAITDMADNANKMGTSMESIQNAYQGFAKANFTMLDNLKLGYGGTQAEMQRLIEDASKMTDVQRELGVTVDATSMSFSNIVNAISVVQASLGIAGATAAEAEKTISGSLNMLKASWKDLLTSIAGGGVGLSEAIDNLVNSADVFLHNVMPVVEEALYGIGDLIQGIAPIIAERLPALIAELAPMLIDTAMSIVTALVNALPSLVASIVQALIDILPQFVDATVGLLNTLLVDIAPLLFEFAVQLIIALGKGIAENLTEITGSIVDLVAYMVETLVMHLPEIIEVGGKIILALTVGILAAVPRLLLRLGEAMGLVKRQVETDTNDMGRMVDSANTEINNKLSSLERDLGVSKDGIKTKTGEMVEVTKQSVTDAQKYSQQIIDTSKATKTKMDTILNGLIPTFNTVLGATNTFVTNFNNYIDKSIKKLEDLSSANVHPSVDPSGVQTGCYAIINAVNDALAALSRLNGASASASVNFGGGHASGGWMNAGTTYLVGELGPELITPSRSGYVHTAEETENIFSGHGDVYITIEGDVYDDETSMRRKLSNVVLDVIGTELAYG